MPRSAGAWGSTAREEGYWRKIRRQFLLSPGEVYLNTGSWGAQPRPVYERLIAGLRELEASPTAHRALLRDRMAEARGELAGFLGVCPEDLAFTVNVTAAVNMVVLGLDWSPGDEILASDVEYGAIDNCLDHAARRWGVVVRRARIPIPPADPQAILDAFDTELTARTRLVLCSHIATATGLILPIRRLAEMAHARGARIVIDGAHAPGMIPLNLTELGCDFYAGNCHKWLCAPKGTGFLHAVPEAQERLHHLIVSWGYSREGAGRDATGRPTINDEPYMWGLATWGTMELAGFAAVGSAVAFQQEIGPDRIAARNRRLAAYLRGRMAKTGWASLLTPDSQEMSCGISTFLLEGFGDLDLRALLHERYRISTPVTAVEGRHRQRVSTHICNGFGDVDILVGALEELRKEAAR